MAEPHLNKVIIVGAGIGGLCAAAALAPNAKQIQIYCKDVRPDGPLARKAIPQGNHISILLQAGLRHLEKLFPGIEGELVGAGAAQIRAGSGQQIHINNRWMPERSLDLTFLGLSRPFLEELIYQRVSAIENVTIHTQTMIETLIFAEGSVYGVCGQTAQGEKFSEEADLVIDASGIGGKLLAQLTANFSEIGTDAIDIGVFYSTIFFTKPTEFLDRKENILIIPEAGVSRIGGSLIDIENNQWCISLHGQNHATAPKDFDGWMAMARQLPDTRIWDRANSAASHSQLYTFRKNQAYWRHFESSTIPKGYLPLGDVISSLNPILGQGMTVAIGHALALGEAFTAAGDSEKSWEQKYLEQAAEWSKKGWTTTNSYYQKFSKAHTLSKEQLETLEKFSYKHHLLLEESPEQHLKYVMQSQMLL